MNFCGNQGRAFQAGVVVRTAAPHLVVVGEEIGVRVVDGGILPLDLDEGVGELLVEFRVEVVHVVVRVAVIFAVLFVAAILSLERAQNHLAAHLFLEPVHLLALLVVLEARRVVGGAV